MVSGLDKNPFEDDEVALDETQLSRLAEIANRMLDHEKEILKLQNMLEAEQKIFRRLNEFDLPELMESLGLQDFTTSNGVKLSINKFYSAKIPEAKEQEAFAWLKETGNDAMIKSKVDCTFGRGEEERVQESALIDWMENNGVPFKQKRSIHHTTLRAFVKNRIESGEPLDLEMFGVYVGNRVKIKR